jgi:hypothetical protein
MLKKKEALDSTRNTLYVNKEKWLAKAEHLNTWQGRYVSINMAGIELV